MVEFLKKLREKLKVKPTYMLPSLFKCIVLLDFTFFLSRPVSALILEEVAIDCLNKAAEKRLLRKAEVLHLESLMLAT